ncbi:MAG: ABC transporter permease [Chloroflexi bacterium]|nr:MAG: ABC transporter permease [Chloroflexota bacterium]
MRRRPWLAIYSPRGSAAARSSGRRTWKMSSSTSPATSYARDSVRNPLLALTITAFKMYLRNRQVIFFNLFFPVMIVVIFGLINGNGNVSVSMGVVDNAHNQVSQIVLTQLRQIKAVRLNTGSLDTERAALEKGERDVVVVLPASLGQGPVALPAFYNAGKPQESSAALAIMSRFVDEASFQYAHIQPSFTLDAQPVNSRNLSYIDFLVPGVIAMSIMQTGLFSVAFSFVAYKQQGILRRLMATPMRVPDFLMSRIVTYLVMAVVQMAILIVLGLLLYHLHFVGNIAYLIIVGFIGAAIFMAVGFTISGFARDEGAVAAIANLISFPMMFLSGVFFSLSNEPGWLQPITKVLPLTFLANALRSISLDGASLWAVRGELLGLAVWLVIALVLATRLFKWEVA